MTTVADDDDDLAILGGFLSETTRKVRRVLLSVGGLAIAVHAFHVRVQNVALLGTTIQIGDERWLSLGLAFMLLYFAALFAVYAFSDFHRNSEAIFRIAKVKPFTPEQPLTHRQDRTAATLMWGRLLIDLLVPLVVAGVGAFLGSIRQS